MNIQGTMRIYSCQAVCWCSCFTYDGIVNFPTIESQGSFSFVHSIQFKQRRKQRLIWKGVQVFIKDFFFVVLYLQLDRRVVHMVIFSLNHFVKVEQSIQFASNQSLCFPIWSFQIGNGESGANPSSKNFDWLTEQ